MIVVHSDQKDWHSMRVGCSEGAISWESGQGKAVSKGKDGSMSRAETGWVTVLSGQA